MAEDVDTEALQAQVDRSVARVQEIVSGWMKPYQGSYEASRVQEMMERDIEIYSARPPHLGVGAIYEPATSDSRDVARLKGRLTQKKRDTEPGSSEVTITKMGGSVDEDEDDEDSRTKVFAKKAKAQRGAVDKFSSRGKKKAAATPAAFGTANASPSSPKKKESDLSEATGGDDCQFTATVSPAALPETSLNGISTGSTSTSTSLLISAPASASMPPPSSVKSQSPKLTPISFSTNVLSPHRTPTKSKERLLFDQPIFGAPGPGVQDQTTFDNDSENEDDDNKDTHPDTTVDTNTTMADQTRASTFSHKRKRKRRKKKHHLTSETDADSQLSNASTPLLNRELHLQLIPQTGTGADLSIPSPSQARRADSITSSESQSVTSLTTGPPPSASTLSSRAGSPDTNSTAGSLGGNRLSQENGFVLGPGVPTPTPSTSSLRASKVSIKGLGIAPKSLSPSPKKRSGMTNRRRQLYEKIAAKERQNSLVNKWAEASGDT